MKKLILASVSAIALFGVAACSDSGTDSTTTESVKPPVTEQPATPATPEASPPATDNTTTKSITPAPESGTSGEMQNTDPMQPKPVEPAAPAQ